MNRRTTHAHVVLVAPQSATFARADTWRGSTLIEVLVALGIVAVALTVFLSVLQIGVRTVASIDEQSVATMLARSQMETVKTAPWPGPYPQTAAPAGYTVQVTTASGPIASIQVITVRVQHQGREILSVEGYKGQR